MEDSLELAEAPTNEPATPAGEIIPASEPAAPPFDSPAVIAERERRTLAAAQYHRAREMLAEGNAPQARLHVQRALELRPDFPEAKMLQQEVETALREPPPRKWLGWPIKRTAGVK